MSTLHCKGCSLFQKVKGEAQSRKAEVRGQESEIIKGKLDVKSKPELDSMQGYKEKKRDEDQEDQGQSNPDVARSTFPPPLNVGVRPLASRSPSEITPPA